MGELHSFWWASGATREQYGCGGLCRINVEVAEGWDAVIPRLADSSKFEPFKAVYKKSCLGPIKTEIEKGNRKVLSFFNSVQIRYLEKNEVEYFDPEFLSFYNVNTPEQLVEAEKIAERKDIIG